MKKMNVEKGNMDLRTFISQSIKDIFDGVIEAQDYAITKKGYVNVYEKDCMRNIHFDIAVTNLSGTEASGSAGAKIYIASAGIAGKRTIENSTISRLKFIIPVELPRKVQIDKDASPDSPTEI